MNRSTSLSSLFQGAANKRGLIFGTIILIALLGFEVFNFSSTSFALRDILGDLSFGSLRWATILALAFCGIDFAGIARIFTPERGRDEPAEVWYLFGAWFLAAAFNATLTWWGVSVAVLQHSAQGGVLCSCSGALYPCPAHQYVLDRRGTSLYDCGSAIIELCAEPIFLSPCQRIRPQSSAVISAPYAQADNCCEFAAAL
jgi:hypothetical protein